MSNPNKRLHSLDSAENRYRAYAQYEFLAAVDAEVPKAAGRLAAKVGPYATKVDIFELSVLRVAGEKATSSGDPRLQRRANLLQEVEAWGIDHNLNESWILQHALSLLWHSTKDAKKWLQEPRLGIGFQVGGIAYTPPQTMSLPPYRPDHETRQWFMDRVREYAENVEETFKAEGWRQEPYKPHLRMHLRWLARFQVGPKTVEDIAASEGVSKRNVERALSECAELVELKRRTLL